MHALDRPEFMPPAPPGLMRAFGLAILAHVMLLVALTFAVNWKHQPDVVSAEAELWSAVPQQAAPKLVETPPEPEPEPKPEPKPAPKVEAPKPDPALAEAEINLKKEKKRKEEKLRLEEEKKRELAKKEAEKKETEKLEKLKKEKEKKLADEKKQAEDKKLAQEKKRKEDAKREEENKALEKQRQDNLKRIAGMAGATGGATATGNAQVSSGPSASYPGRIVARIKPNIVLTSPVAGNPVAEVEVRTSPDGTIVGRKLLKSSGVPAWDDAVLKAIDKTEVLPRDVDGRVPSTLVIGFRPLD
jgi:colicin import membrane protein